MKSETMPYRIVMHIFGWSIFFVASGVFKIGNIGLEAAIGSTLFGGVLHIGLFYFYAEIGVDRFFEKGRIGLFILTSVVLFFFFSWIRFTLEYPLFPAFFNFIHDNSNLIKWRWFPFSILLNMMVSFAYRLLENRIMNEKRIQEQINQQQGAQLLYLKSQINPHFLFNALNNIYSLSVMKSDQTPKMILQLSNLLRYSIYEGQKDKVALAHELEQINKYLDMFSMTKETPPDVSFQVNGDLNGWTIEPMTLIPIIENGIKHGDFDSNPKAYLNIELTVGPDRLQFKTVNTTNPQNQQKDQVGGVGLTNIKTRLSLRYPEHQFETVDQGDRFEVFLAIKKPDA